MRYRQVQRMCQLRGGARRMLKNRMTPAFAAGLMSGCQGEAGVSGAGFVCGMYVLERYVVNEIRAGILMK